MGLLSIKREKLNPAQSLISGGGTLEESSHEPVYTYQSYYERLEIVNRGVNMVVDDVSQIDYSVENKIPGVSAVVKNIRKTQLLKLLNEEPNPFQDISSFRRALLLDLLIDGNIFIYWDGASLYHLPAVHVKVVADKETRISHYEYDSSIKYQPEEIIHISDNNYRTLFRGSSRLKPALGSMNRIAQMTAFQDNFFKNGAVPGLVLQTEERLNERHKDKLLQDWSCKYKPSSGGRRPVILDGGLKIANISNVNFRELDFQNSVTESEKIVLKALGIPPILLDSGNNANIRPNHRMYYLETIIPIVHKITSALRRFFGFDIYENTTYIHALRPELQEEAAYFTTLVNGGVISANEARVALGREPVEGHDDLRIPANIAGSAADPSQGGRPPQKEE